MPGVVQATAQEISILSAVDLVDLDCTVPDVLRSLYAFGMGRKTENWNRINQNWKSPTEKTGQYIGSKFYKPNLVWSSRSLVLSNRINETEELYHSAPIFRTVWYVWIMDLWYYCMLIKLL
jgi:hypothetical protein